MRSDSHIKKQAKKKFIKTGISGVFKYLLYITAAVSAVISGILFSAAFEIENVKNDLSAQYAEKGDIIILNRAAYIYGSPRKGDIVAVRTSLHKCSNDCSLKIGKVFDMDENGETLYVIPLGMTDAGMIEGRVDKRIKSR